MKLLLALLIIIALAYGVDKLCDSIDGACRSHCENQNKRIAYDMSGNCSCGDR